MTTILEALQNAQYNLVEGMTQINKVVGKEQLHNAITLLEKGYDINDSIDDLINEYDDIDKAPDKPTDKDRG